MKDSKYWFTACAGDDRLLQQLKLKYCRDMTNLLEQAVAAARDLPADMQDDIARVLLQLTGQPNETIGLTLEEQEAIALSKAAAARGDFATDEQVRSAWAKHRL